MEGNSIRRSLDKESILAEIRMTLSADFEHKKLIIVVEGESDVLFLRGRFSQNVEILESFSGKHGVDEIVEASSDVRVIGICDRDYDEPSGSPCIFYYDHCCLEMMLIANDSVFSPLCATYYSRPDDPAGLRLRLLTELRLLSTFRKLNTISGWEVNFRGISLSKAYKKATMQIDYTKVLAQIKGHNPSIADYIRDYLEQVSAQCRDGSTLEDLLNITQGHDFLSLFQAVCAGAWTQKSSMPNKTELERALICSFRAEDFRATALLQKLRDYQDSTDLCILPA